MGIPGAGIVLDAIARIRNNETLLRKKSYFKTMGDYLHVSNGEKISFREASPELLEEIRRKMIRKRQRELIHTLLALLLTLILTALVLWGIIFLVERFLITG